MGNARGVVDRLAALLEYPGDAYGAALEECRAAMTDACPAGVADLDRFAEATRSLSVPALQELYVATFDLNPRCTLDLGWHVYGEAYERGALLAMLRAELQDAEVAERGELPDHLPAVLMLLERVDAPRRAELSALLTPAVTALQAALASLDSPYAGLLQAVAIAATAGG